MFSHTAGFFNWTVTYRRDSTVHYPYGEIVEPDDVVPEQWQNYNETEFKLSLKFRNKSFLALAKKPKLVAWIVSNCRASSKREEYVKLLQKEIPGEQYKILT